MTGWTSVHIISTLFGAALFPFMLAVGWGKMVEAWGAAGGWMAGFWIVGVSWLLNHGLGLHHQAGEVWIDMALAGAVGLYVQSTLAGGKPSKSVPALISGILGGLLGGLILSIMA